jgi:hypothetical protein
MQYRSAICTFDEDQARVAKELKNAYEPLLAKRGYEDVPAVPREELARPPLPQRGGLSPRTGSPARWEAVHRAVGGRSRRRNRPRT